MLPISAGDGIAQTSLHQNKNWRMPLEKTNIGPACPRHTTGVAIDQELVAKMQNMARSSQFTITYQPTAGAEQNTDHRACTPHIAVPAYAMPSPIRRCDQGFEHRQLQQLIAITTAEQQSQPKIDISATTYACRAVAPSPRVRRPIRLPFLFQPFSSPSSNYYSRVCLGIWHIRHNQQRTLSSFGGG